MRDHIDRDDKIIDTVKLNGGAVLHRVERDGMRVSTIWHHGVECWSCFRGCEADMIEAWNESHQ